MPVGSKHGGDGSGQRGAARDFITTSKGRHTSGLSNDATKDSQYGITGDDGEDYKGLSACRVVKMKLGL